MSVEVGAGLICGSPLRETPSALHSLAMRFKALFLLLAVPLCAQTDLSSGRKIFEAQCALCHGQTGTGGRGPSLNRPKLNHAPDDEALKKVISEGIDPEMPGAWQLHPREVDRVAAYVRSLGTVPPEQVR